MRCLLNSKGMIWKSLNRRAKVKELGGIDEPTHAGLHPKSNVLNFNVLIDPTPKK